MKKKSNSLLLQLASRITSIIFWVPSALLTLLVKRFVDPTAREIEADRQEFAQRMEESRARFLKDPETWGKYKLQDPADWNSDPDEEEI